MSVSSGVRRNREKNKKDSVAPVHHGPWEPPGRVVRSPYFRWKGTIDAVLSAMLAVLSLPVVALLVVVVRLTSPGPAIYRQVRVGKDGRLFMMYKIRTMRRDAEVLTGAVWTKVNDCRVTRVGKVLRKLHLDEFPQLLNVLRGEMSLIGPRPERPEFVAMLSETIPGYLERLAVRPGITGLAQINLPPDSDLDSVRRKIVLDVEYIKHAGPLLDLRMSLCTMMRLLGLPGMYAMKLFRLGREVNLSELPPVTATPLAAPPIVAAGKPALGAGLGLPSGKPASGNGNGNVGGNGDGGANGSGSGSSRRRAIVGKPR